VPRLRRCLAAFMLAACLSPCGPALAYGQGATCTTPDGDSGHIVVDDFGVSVCVVDAGTPTSTSGPDANDSAPASDGAACRNGVKSIPCVTDLGVWFSSHQCYASAAEPQPPARSPLWGSHDSIDGSLWICRTYEGPATGGLWFFVPAGERPALIDPGELAESAMASMPFEAAKAQVAPGPNWHTFLGIENWMWIPEAQWRPLSLTVSAGGTSVTVRAVPVRVEWDMGTEIVTCPDAGRPWRVGMSDEAQTTCAYTYTSMETAEGDIHRVTASIVYQLDWTCAGACVTQSGTLSDVVATAGAATSIEVLQRQTVVTG
jgi:hypothetical protein